MTGVKSANCNTNKHQGLENATVEFQHGHAFPSFFIERGRYSQHVYQPQVNHRSLEYSNFHSTMVDDMGVETIPLLESMVSDEPQYDFSTGSNVHVVFYQMNEGLPGSTGRPIMTQNLIEVHMDQDNHFLEHGSIANRFAGDVTLYGLKRAYEFFNLDWSCDESCEVLHKDMVSFMSLFKDVDLRSFQSFQETVLDKFSLNNVFVLDKS